MKAKPAKRNIAKYVRYGLFTLVTAAVIAVSSAYYLSDISHKSAAAKMESEFFATKTDLEKDLEKAKSEYEALKKEDQRVRNDRLEKEIQDIQKTYKDSVTAYEKLLKLKEQTNKTVEFDERFTKILTSLSDKDYASASGQLASLKTDIDKKQAEIAASFQIPASVPVNNTAPGSGYQRQNVQNEFGSYLVDVIAADLNSARVVVDTASDSTCGNDCPVAALGDFAARSGAFAGINGPYFCPASYPSCAGKTNSFDTLIMNKNKVYFNSDNNVYSSVPAVIFSGGSARYVGQSSQWGRDTGADAVIAAQPMLVSNGEVVFGGDEEAKRAGKGSRSFIGSTGSTVYIGVVHNANVAEVARVLKTMGIQNALNLDSGGSTALWSNGSYLVGPGRSTPFGILLLRR